MENSLSLSAGSSMDSYVSSSADSFRPGASSEISSFNVAVDGGFERRFFSGELNVENKYSFTEQANYLHVNEASVAAHANDVDLTLGRHHQLWSETDLGWRRGLWAPRYMEDKLNAETSVLTGFTAEWTRGEFSLTGFGSYVFVPEIGPKVDVDNGQLISKNPWFSPPSPTMQLFNQTGTTAIHYDLAAPAVAAMVFQPSLILAGEWQNQDGFFVRAAAADKPMNQLVYAFPFTVRTLPNEMRLDVDIHVRTVRHRLGTIEAGQNQEGGWHNVVAYTYEAPQADPMPGDWISQSLEPAQIFSGAVGYDLKRSGPKATFASLSYSKVQTRPEQDRGEMASGPSLFESRFEYFNSVKAELRSPVWLKGGQVLRATGSVLCDFQQQAFVYSTALEYWQDRLRLFLRGDFFQLIKGQTTAANDGFIRHYQSNDRLSLGMSYVF